MTGKQRKRVWIDSQTEEEILRGIRQAKDLSEYDNLSASAYLRAKEDYLMGINFSRLLTLKYGNSISGYLKTKYAVVSVGRENGKRSKAPAISNRLTCTKRMDSNKKKRRRS